MTNTTPADWTDDDIRRSKERQMQDQLDELGNELDAIDPYSLMGIIADHLGTSQQEVLKSPMMLDILQFSQSAGKTRAVEILRQMRAMEDDIADI